MMDNPLPLLGFVAWSGTGKTTLLEQLIPLLNQRGLRLGVLKHTHHDFDTDQPGKDSYRLRKAGALQVMAASSRRHARIVETPDGEAPFAELLASFDWTHLDLLLIEGFKHQHFPKVELHRGAIGRPLLFPDDPDIVALISDRRQETRLPQFDFGDLPAIADFIYARLASRPISRQPLRLLAQALVDMPGQNHGDDARLGHLTQDAHGVLQVQPASTMLAANCLIETDPAGASIVCGERIQVRPLPAWIP